MVMPPTPASPAAHTVAVGASRRRALAAVGVAWWIRPDLCAGRRRVTVLLRALRSFALPGLVLMASVVPGQTATPTSPEAAAAGPPPVITTVAEASARWPHITAETEPVYIEGVVTGTVPSGAFRLHDGERGIYVGASDAGRAVSSRDRVAVYGVLAHGGFSPWIRPREIVPLGTGTLPKPIPATFSLLASGTADNQWLEIVGVVRSVDDLAPEPLLALDLAMEGGNVRVLVDHPLLPEFEAMIDAEVRIQGVGTVIKNRHRQVVQPLFRVSGLQDIAVIRGAPADAFDLPLVPIGKLMGFMPGTSHRHRVRTRGVVTRQLSPRTFFVRDGDLGLKVEMHHPVSLRPGDVVEAAGFPVIEGGVAVLERSVCRVTGHEGAPSPVRADVAGLLDGALNSNLVSMQARLLDWSATSQPVKLVFQAGNYLFSGLLDQPAATAHLLPPRGSIVEVTGICVISELEDVWFYQPRSFVLLLADPADLALMQTPPWWTPERLWLALAIAGIVLLAAGAWVWALRRQMHRKRAVIEQQARHAAVLEERSRIARELHDTLEQGLTGLSLQMKAMETDLDGTPQQVRSRLQYARQMLRQSRALARTAIRELRSEAIPTQVDGLVEGLHHVAEAWNRSGALRVQVKVMGELRPLSPRVEHHLLRIGTEAMINAVKHGRAPAVEVEVDFGPSEVLLRVKDNGAGFDPTGQLDKANGCFGLLGMRERAREVGGHIRIHSQPGHGTEIYVAAPLGLGAPLDPSLA